MLNVTVTPHREFLPADADNQKLFLMLKLRPSKEVSQEKPPITFTFVIDTSGSMYEVVTGVGQPTGRTYEMDGKEYTEVTGARSKIDIVMESLNRLIDSGSLKANDKVAIIQFDDTASTLIGLTPATEVDSLKGAVSQLQNFSGGTRMGLGMEQALKLLSNQTMTSRRVLLFTDGATIDEDYCLEISQQFTAQGIPVTALGFGDEFNENLLTSLSDITGGSTSHVVPPDKASGVAISINDLPAKIAQEFSTAQNAVINNLAMVLKTVRGIKLDRLVRAYPTQADLPITQESLSLGYALANDETVFILELELESRPAGRIRMAQLGLTYDVPGQNRRGEFPIQDIVVQFVAGQMAAQVNQEVMGYVQQCNVAQLVNQAALVANSNPEKADELLETARKVTQRLGNTDMAESLKEAQDELRKTRKLSSGTRKTVKIGSKGKTIRMNQDLDDILTEEEIRDRTGV